MFGQYIPIGLEPPAWRIVHCIRVVPFTLVKVEPPIQRAASKVYPVFLTQLNLNKMLLWKPNEIQVRLGIGAFRRKGGKGKELWDIYFGVCIHNPELTTPMLLLA